MRPDVVLVLPSLRGGGAEFVAQVWAEGLVALGHRVQVVLLRARADEPTLEGVEVVSASREGAGRSAEMKALRAYLKRVRPALAIGMMTRANFQLLAVVQTLPKSERPKVAISERNIPFAEAEHSAAHIFTRDRAYRGLYPKADAFIAISHSVGAVFQYAARLDRNRIWVVPNPAIAKSGVALPEDPAPTTLRSVSLVVPARIVAKKRPLLAIEIADRLAPHFDQLRLLYFGQGEMSAEIGRVKRDYSIELPGRVENWFDHIPADGIVLLPSAVEGFGNVLLEAAARGVPSVVGSTAFGSSDAIVPGVTGYFARADSVDEYVDAVLRASKLDRAAPAGWLNEFSKENSIEMLLRVMAALR